MPSRAQRLSSTLARILPPQQRPVEVFVRTDCERVAVIQFLVEQEKLC